MFDCKADHIYRRVAIGAVALLALSLAASTAVAQTPCKTDRDCPNKGLCMAGKCSTPAPPPTTDPTPAPAPAPAPLPECTAATDCAGADMTCVDGKCVEQQPAPAPAPAPAPVPPAPGCARDTDCPGEQVCRDGNCGAPVAPEPTLGCVRDVDCKGDRICVSGECVTPGEGDVKLPTLAEYKDIPMTGEPNWFQGYLQISGLLQIHSWGRWSSNDPTGALDPKPEGDVQGNVWGGVHVAAFYAPVEIVQVGAFFIFTTGTMELTEDSKYDGFHKLSGDAMINSFGVSIKVGGRPTGHVWVGGAVDVGYAMWDFDEFLLGETDFRAHAVLIFPRVAIDILAVDTGGFKLAFPISVGAIATPYAYGESDLPTYDPDIEVEPWVISPAVTAGIALGGGRPSKM